MKFYKYQHLENRLDSIQCTGLLSGMLTIQPKLDGSNCQIWMENGKLVISSRNNILGNHLDNHGCYQTLKNDQRFIDFFTANPHVKLIGEWLVPHTIKYREDAYQELYIFDGILIDIENETGHSVYIDYSFLQSHLSSYDISYVPYLQINAEDWDKSYKTIIDMRPDFNWLLPNQEDEGEGIVVKNYGYKSIFGRSVWCKVINEEFYKIKAVRSPKVKRESTDITKEIEFVEKHLSLHLLSKQLQKLGDFDKSRIGEYIRSCQLEFIEDFIDEKVDVNVKVINNLIAPRVRDYLISIKYL